MLPSLLTFWLCRVGTKTAYAVELYPTVSAVLPALTLPLVELNRVDSAQTASTWLALSVSLTARRASAQRWLLLAV